MLGIKDWGHFIRVDPAKVEEQSCVASNELLNQSNSEIFTYVVLPRLGTNLNHLFNKRKGQFTKEQTCSLGIQLVNILEQVHAAGLVFNDLKLDNLLLDAGINLANLCAATDDFFDVLNVTIIDFGFATPYWNKKANRHISKKYVDVFRGSIMYSSVH